MALFFQLLAGLLIVGIPAALGLAYVMSKLIVREPPDMREILGLRSSSPIAPNEPPVLSSASATIVLAIINRGRFVGGAPTAAWNDITFRQVAT